MKFGKRIILAKTGNDPYIAEIRKAAGIFAISGYQVIYLGASAATEMIVLSAINEDPDAILIEFSPGKSMQIFLDIKKMLMQKGKGEILLTGRGILPEAEHLRLNTRGVGRIFSSETRWEEILKYVSNWIEENPRI